MKKNKISIFILIDALGWMYIKDRAFLNNVVKTKRAVKSLMGYSSAILPSILTGKYPDQHQHWSIFYYNPINSIFKWAKVFTWLPKFCLNNRFVRKITEIISQKKAGYSGYFETYLVPIELLPYFDVCEKRNIYKPGGFENCKSIFDIWQEQGIKYNCLTYPLKDKEIFQSAAEKMESEDTSIYFLYLADFDAFLHRHCKDNQLINKEIDCYEKSILHLLEVAHSKFAKVDFYMFSDHGMTPTESTVNLKEKIDNLGFKVLNDYLVIYDSTMVRFWFFNDEARKAITTFLKATPQGKILSDEELKYYRIFFADRKYGEIIFLMNPGCLINPSFISHTPPIGMHGFSPEIDTADAVLISNVEINRKLKDVTSFFEIMKDRHAESKTINKSQ